MTVPWAMSCTRTSGRIRVRPGGWQPRRRARRTRPVAGQRVVRPGADVAWCRAAAAPGGRKGGRVCPAINQLAAARAGGRPSPRIGRQHDGNDDTAMTLALRVDLTAESLHGALHAPQAKPARSVIVRCPPTEPCRDGRKIMLEDEVRIVTAAAILDEQAGARPVGFER